MRTFHHIDLYSKIKSNPYIYLGQRDFNLFEYFMSAINSYTEVIINSKDHETNQTPSIREFISDQLNIKTPESLKWTWAIGFIVESRRELLDTYFDWIDKYENEYPTSQNNYNFVCKLPKEFNISNIIRPLCEKRGLFNTGDIAGLRATIDGFFYLKDTYKIPLTTNDQTLKQFIDFWKAKTNKKLPFDTWDRPLIKEKMNINPFLFSDGSNGGYTFERFIAVFEKQTGLILS